MAVPSPEEIRQFLIRGYALWNEDDKERWLQHQRSFGTGEPSFEDPVGSPRKRGWDVLSEMWDATGTQRLHIEIQHIIVCGNEAVVVALNFGAVKGNPLLIRSVDCYRFEDDGSTFSRTFWEPPSGQLPYLDWSKSTGDPAP